jgi:hypothetical protein
VAKFHVIKDSKKEIMFGLIFFAIGSFLLWDAWAHRGKNTPWPLGAVMPF